MGLVLEKEKNTIFLILYHTFINQTILLIGDMGDFVRNFERRRSGRGRFDRKGPGSFGRRDYGRDRERDRPSEMHPAVCDKCGRDCEVPFKPTQGKPIYCNDCFKDKSREIGSRSEFGRKSNEDVDQINRKLDRILKILESPVVEETPENKSFAEYSKKGPKKRAKKKKSQFSD